MNAVLRPAFAHKLGHSTTYRAWRLSGETARELDIGTPDSLSDALTAALTHFFAHHDTLFIHEQDDGRRKGTLHSYAIRKKKAMYVANPCGGAPVRVEPLFPDPMFALPVDAFEPTRAFDALRDDAVGVDRTLVESR